MLNNPIIIVCSGNSIPFDTEEFVKNGTGLPLHLREVIETNFSVGINSFYRFGTSNITWLQFGDYQFYENNLERIKELPLIIGKHSNQLINLNILQSNTILIPTSKMYSSTECWNVNCKKCVNCKTISNKNIKHCPNCKGNIFLSLGFYTHILTNVMTLTLVIALGFKKIFILGMDAKEIDGKTHFYQNLINPEKIKKIKKSEWRGIGKTNNGYNTSNYNNPKNLNESLFAPYIEELDKGIEIYNVSPDSAINVFPKISYEEFYSIVKKTNYKQTELQEFIKSEINKRIIL